MYRTDRQGGLKTVATEGLAGRRRGDVPSPAKLFLVAGVVLLAASSSAQAYIGPGAGFALAGSFMAVLTAMFSAVVLLFTWPVRCVVRAIRAARGLARSRVKRVVILGLDGLDHRLTEQLMAEGALPHMAALRDRGCFKPLASTVPPISPVAWSSFQTGVNPGKHNIFDFLTPDLRTYEPKLSSVDIRPPTRSISLGKYRWPLGKAEIRLLRKSVPFWQVLGKSGIFSSILRVPISFPPEKLRGVQLSAMCVPDLRGTQGTFSFYTTGPGAGPERTGGEVRRVTRKGNTVEMELIGPENPLRKDQAVMTVPLTATIRDASSVDLQINGEKHRLRKDEYSAWLGVSFRAAPGIKVHGMCKFLLLGTQPEFSLYVSPINIDPDRPALPVSYPPSYGKYLAKQQGLFATLGLAEDTWALSEEVISDEAFIQQSLERDQEREKMFFDSLDKVRRGLCVCVFDGTDRIQHTFWRDPSPASESQARLGPHPQVEALYRRMDDLVARTVAQCNDEDTVLMIISDHGFNSFRRGVDLNCWLEANGYLKVTDGRRQEKYLAGVDWSATRAFAIGLAGIFVNLKGRNAQGIVEPGPEAAALCQEIADKLSALTDPADNRPAVKTVYQAAKVYRGPYTGAAPDVIVGYQRGYRVSW
ncbi:MAG: alkaline phosphatase family protein, partial [Planctomycetota bacterium]